MLINTLKCNLSQALLSVRIAGLFCQSIPCTMSLSSHTFAVYLRYKIKHKSISTQNDNS